MEKRRRYKMESSKEKKVEEILRVWRLMENREESYPDEVNSYEDDNNIFTDEEYNELNFDYYN